MTAGRYRRSILDLPEVTSQPAAERCAWWIVLSNSCLCLEKKNPLGFIWLNRAHVLVWLRLTVQSSCEGEMTSTVCILSNFTFSSQPQEEWVVHDSITSMAHYTQADKSWYMTNFSKHGNFLPSYSGRKGVRCSYTVFSSDFLIFFIRGAP